MLVFVTGYTNLETIYLAITFSAFPFQANVEVRLTNPIPHSGLFEVRVPLFPGDTVAKVTARMARNERNIKSKILFCWICKSS